VVLSNPPLNTKNQGTKDAAFNLVLRVLKTIQNSAEIENAVRSLSADAVDVLMKYIYRGFEREPNNSSLLLNWHEKVSEYPDWILFLDLCSLTVFVCKVHAVGGPGCIVRVLSDGRRV